MNHLGHFAFTTALLDHLVASASRDGASRDGASRDGASRDGASRNVVGGRIVSVSSDAHCQASGIDVARLRRRTRSITGMPEYAASKLCNVLFSQELARRLAGTGVTSYALHPGVVASDIWRRVPWLARQLMARRMLTVDEGARTSLYCATAPELAAHSGRYYENCAERAASPVATAELGGQLWEQSETWASG